MDAVLYLKERERIVKTYCSPEATQANCDACPFGDEGCCRARYPDSILSIEEKVAIVEQWSKGHSLKTNIQKFKEVFGGGWKSLPCPPLDCSNTTCGECLEWWGKEYIDPKRRVIYE